MIGELPKSLIVGGVRYPIRSDFRVALLIMEAYGNPDLTMREKVAVCLRCLYKELPSDPEHAYERALWFLDGGDAPQPKPLNVRTMDWEQDEALIFPAINKAAGCETRSAEYLHWWTFLGFFNEIGEGLYSQVMNIRLKRAKGKKLEKWEREFFESHQNMIVLKEKLTPKEQAELNAEQALLDRLTG